MTNTIPNVTRELLERVLNAGWGSETVNALDDLRDFLASAPSPANHVEDVRALLSAPSPAGVDGLEVVGTLRYFMDYPDSPHSAPGYITHQFNPASWDHAGEAAGEHKLCRLSDAQAIIDGLRDEVEVMTQHANNYSRMFEECAEERDRQAQRIGELEGLLRHAQKQVPTGSGLHMRIDAALSAVCAAAPNIATTSEHSGS